MRAFFISVGRPLAQLVLTALAAERVVAECETDFVELKAEVGRGRCRRAPSEWRLLLIPGGKCSTSRIFRPNNFLC